MMPLRFCATLLAIALAAAAPAGVVYRLSGNAQQQAVAFGEVGAAPTSVSASNPLPVMTSSAPAASSTTAGTIATANTFQSALVASATRKGCLVQNTSASALLAFLGAPGSATAAASIVIPPGGSMSCNSPGLVVTDQISLTSAAAGASYVVVSQ